MVTAPVLAPPDFEREFIITSDASAIAIGGCIQQSNGKGGRQVISYYARALKGCEQRYEAVKLELLGLLFVAERAREYLRHTRFPVIAESDHINLQMIATSTKMPAVLSRWLLRLRAIAPFCLTYRPGRDNQLSDYLSRSIFQDSGYKLLPREIVASVTATLRQHIHPMSSMLAHDYNDTLQPTDIDLIYTAMAPLGHRPRASSSTTLPDQPTADTSPWDSSYNIALLFNDDGVPQRLSPTSVVATLPSVTVTRGGNQDEADDSVSGTNDTEELIDTEDDDAGTSDDEDANRITQMKRKLIQPYDFRYQLGDNESANWQLIDEHYEELERLGGKFTMNLNATRETARGIKFCST